MKTVYLIIFTLITFLALLGGVFYYILFTTSGSDTLVRTLLRNNFPAASIKINDIQGHLWQSLRLNGIEIHQLDVLTVENRVTIQDVNVSHKFSNILGLEADLFNGKMELPSSDPIIFQGHFKGGELDFNVFSKGFDIQGILDILKKYIQIKKVSGVILDFDTYLKGTFSQPIIQGKFFIERVRYSEVVLSDAPVSFSVILKKGLLGPKIHGEIVIEKGQASAKNTVVALEQSRIIFSGDPQTPEMDINGYSIIDGIRINIALNGTLQKPDLLLTSESPLNQQELLLMLATGKRWKGVEYAVDSGELTVNAAKDLVDYLFFSRSRNQLFHKLGISDVSVIYNETTQGVEVKKRITENFEANYGYQQETNQTEDPRQKHKVGGSYNVTDNISVEGFREMTDESKESAEELENEKKADSQIMLKYKKAF